ncbi:hypothetical protein CSKR_103910, partial [Clonorchis sinensis]
MRPRTSTFDIGLVPPQHQCSRSIRGQTYEVTVMRAMHVILILMACAYFTIPLLFMTKHVTCAQKAGLRFCGEMRYRTDTGPFVCRRKFSSGIDRTSQALPDCGNLPPTIVGPPFSNSREKTFRVLLLTPMSSAIIVHYTPLTYSNAELHAYDYSEIVSPPGAVDALIVQSFWRVKQRRSIPVDDDNKPMWFSDYLSEEHPRYRSLDCREVKFAATVGSNDISECYQASTITLQIKASLKYVAEKVLIFYWLIGGDGSTTMAYFECTYGLETEAKRVVHSEKIQRQPTARTFEKSQSQDTPNGKASSRSCFRKIYHSQYEDVYRLTRHGDPYCSLPLVNRGFGSYQGALAAAKQLLLTFNNSRVLEEVNRQHCSLPVDRVTKQKLSVDHISEQDYNNQSDTQVTVYKVDGTRIFGCAHLSNLTYYELATRWLEVESFIEKPVRKRSSEMVCPVKRRVLLQSRHDVIILLASNWLPNGIARTLTGNSRFQISIRIPSLCVKEGTRPVFFATYRRLDQNYHSTQRSDEFRQSSAFRELSNSGYFVENRSVFMLTLLLQLRLKTCLRNTDSELMSLGFIGRQKISHVDCIKDLVSHANNTFYGHYVVASYFCEVLLTDSRVHLLPAFNFEYETLIDFQVAISSM